MPVGLPEFVENPENRCPVILLLDTSGSMSGLAIRLSDWKPHPPFFKPLEEYLRETDKPGGNDDNYIIDFLNSERLNSRTDDDKTLLLCLFE
jgi:hypothetical protein